MPDDVFDLYAKACDRVDQGNIERARKLLKDHPEFLISLEKKIRPDTEDGMLQKVERLAKIASVNRGKAWIYQLEYTGACKYSRLLLKENARILAEFFDRQGLRYRQLSKLHSEFYEFYYNELGPIRAYVYAKWTEFNVKKPKGVRFKNFIQIQASTNPQEFNEPRRILSRYERPWVI
jgi:hypothetical protein